MDEPVTKPVSIKKQPVTPVAHAKVKEKTGIKKLADIFVKKDFDTVKDHIFADLIIPSIQKLIVDAVQDGIAMLVYGETRSAKRSGPRTSYESFYGRSSSNIRRETRTTRTNYACDDIFFDTKAEADDVISAMDDIIEQYGVVSVLDLYDLVDMPGNYTDAKYGWTDIRSAMPIRTRDGDWTIRFPKVTAI